MKKLKSFVESNLFQNFIMGVIIFNSVLMGLQTSHKITGATGNLIPILDGICLGIFIIELFLKFVVYRFNFFKSSWNIFDLVIVLVSILSSLTFLSVFRIFRIFRVLRSLKSLKALKNFRAFMLVSGIDKLRVIISAIGRSIPGILWSAVLMLLIYYIFAIIGTTTFGEQFPEWFGTLGKSMYTLFQVMTLESWSMGISRPVMEVYPWAWIYFVPFVLIASFIVMNVVVGIVVNSISEVAAENPENSENAEASNSETISEMPTDMEALKKELAALRLQLDKVQSLVDSQTK